MKLFAGSIKRPVTSEWSLNDHDWPDPSEGNCYHCRNIPNVWSAAGIRMCRI